MFHKVGTLHLTEIMPILNEINGTWMEDLVQWIATCWPLSVGLSYQKIQYKRKPC